MRRTSDLTIDRPRRRFSGRGLIIGIGAFFLFVLVFGRAIARFYVDYLWHKALGRGDMFWGVIGAKFTLFVGFFLVFLLIAGLNLFIADRTAPDVVPGQRPSRTSNASTTCSATGSGSFGTPARRCSR